MMAAAVYAAMVAVTQEFSGGGIAKSHINAVDQYQYRSIDDVLNRLSPLLAKYRLCVLPRVVERLVTDRAGVGEGLLVNVALKVAYTIVSADDGSTHLIEAYGEALDPGDKATAKAMSAAYKAAMLQAFCIPVTDGPEPESRGYRLLAKTHGPSPVEGWEQWVADITEIARSCESEDALSRMQQTHRARLTSLSRERPDLYSGLGDVFNERRAQLRLPEPKPRKPKSERARPRPRTDATAREPAHVE